MELPQFRDVSVKPSHLAGRVQVVGPPRSSGAGPLCPPLESRQHLVPGPHRDRVLERRPAAGQSYHGDPHDLAVQLQNASIWASITVLEGTPSDGNVPMAS